MNRDGSNTMIKSWIYDENDKDQSRIDGVEREVLFISRTPLQCD